MAILKIDDEPWYWCSDCKSPNIKSICGLNYCQDCQSASISIGKIEDWQKEYKAKYNEEYCVIKNK